MPAPLSIIIPTLNAASDLPETLAHLMPGVQAGLIAEVIVVDGGSADDTCGIADGWGASVLQAEASRGGQLHAGAGAAKAQWFLFLHADTHLPRDWAQTAEAHLARETAACFRLSFRAKGFAPALVSAWANLRTRLFKLPYGDQSLLIPAKLYHAIGGYPDQPLMEDVAIARKLPKVVVLDGFVRTGADKYLSQGWITRGRKNLWLLMRYLGGADPNTLAADYRMSKR